MLCAQYHVMFINLLFDLLMHHETVKINFGLV